MVAISALKMERDQETGISILVVGAGISGLSFAIEAYRKGHHVRVVERRIPKESAGEVISIAASALHTPKKWPGFMDLARKRALPPLLTIKKSNGEKVETFNLGDANNPSLAIYRSELHLVLHEYAALLGIPIEFAATAVGFFETEDHGGVVLQDGREITADVIVAADGVGSKSSSLVVGKKTAPISSGFVLYRITFPAAPALKNPVIAKAFEGIGDHTLLHAGPGAHMVSNLSGDVMCWMLTCREDSDEAEENWAKATSIARPLEVTQGWEPYVTELIKATPNHTVLDWKLMWRDPEPHWASPIGRVVQIGDAAHSFLPTSASGGTMAMEDAFSLAACLQIAGKDNVCMATKVHNHLRFERVSSAQKMGFKNREVFHNTDWGVVAKNPQVIGKMVGDWVIYHDPEQYAYDAYASCAQHLLVGAPFEHKNTVPGHRYTPWTVKELLEASARDEPIEDEGDWS
ncbi:hypothetical protein C7974DRAFT_422392 [Boeremia exigua]|uniref:uncharacterized protein n=1 Tax=Boeremia exigua TaxID=749465 RepID=UPI001E8E02E6|nr:uncharacterized protein C7974DRAFT_422392 [Boeremia exigua]KAH6639900.1 hypothetical protein C7974DRAFT_422392 [Boeremia exigua]